MTKKRTPPDHLLPEDKRLIRFKLTNIETGHSVDDQRRLRG